MKKFNTLQQIFDHVIAHLLKQGEKSANVTGTQCAYSGCNGTSCAVGCLISDEAYDKYGKDIEGSTVNAIRKYEPEVREEILSDIDLEIPRVWFLLEELQFTHDFARPNVGRGRSWQSFIAKRAANIAKQFQLDFTKPPAIEGDQR